MNAIVFAPHTSPRSPPANSPPRCTAAATHRSPTPPPFADALTPRLATSAEDMIENATEIYNAATAKHQRLHVASRHLSPPAPPRQRRAYTRSTNAATPRGPFPASMAPA